MHKREPRIIKEFHEFHDYVGLLGKHVNQINRRFEKIEQSNKELTNNMLHLSQDILQICYHLEKINENINMIKSSHKKYVVKTTEDLTNIKENIVNRTEFSNFKEELKDSIGELYPPLPTLVQEPTTTVMTSHEAYQHMLLPAVTKRAKMKN